MKPINKKERSKAMFRVVGLFLVSFIIAMVLGFTTMNIQKLSDTKSNNDLENLKSQLKFQEEVFAPSIDEITGLFDKVPAYKEGEGNIDLLNADIASKLSSTQSQIVQDESWESKLYLNVVKTYSDLQVALKEQASLQEELDICKNSSSGAGDQVGLLLAQNEQLKKEVDQLKRSAGGGGTPEEVADLQKKLKDAKQELKDCQTETKALLSQIDKLKK